MLHLTLTRTFTSKSGTRGVIVLPSGSKIFTLEPWLYRKDYPCIPTGTYDVVMKYSPKFGRLMPTLLDVPGRRGILIHTGNISKETRGCILVGFSFVTHSAVSSRLASSRFAYSLLLSHFESALNFVKFKDGDKVCTLTVTDIF